MWDSYKEELGFDHILISEIPSRYITPSCAQSKMDGQDGIIDVTDISNEFLVENGLMASDNIHYTQQGRLLIAHEWSKYYLDVYFSKNMTGKTIAREYYSIPIIIVFISIGAIYIHNRRK